MDVRMKMALLAMGHEPSHIEQLEAFDLWDALMERWVADQKLIVCYSARRLQVDTDGMLLWPDYEGSHRKARVWYESAPGEDYDKYATVAVLIMRKDHGKPFEIVKPRRMHSWSEAWSDATLPETPR